MTQPEEGVPRRQELIRAFELVLRQVAVWRHSAMDDPEEFERRDLILLQLEAIAREAMGIL